MTHIMIDVESSATVREAKLLSIGACVFLLDRAPDLQKLMRDTFYVNVGPYEKNQSAFVENEATLKWWQGQGEEAKQVLEHDRIPPFEAIARLHKWITGLSDNPIMWANPPQFDLTIIKYHMDVFGLEWPWHWSKERDFRTLRETIKEKKNFVPDEPKAFTHGDKTLILVKHNALHDAIAQADKLQQIVQYMKK